MTGHTTAAETSIPRQDEYVPGVPNLMDAATLKRFCELSPWRSTLHIAGEWMLIALAIWYGIRQAPWFAYPLLIAFIGARQHALALLAHDGAHGRLYHDRRINDWVSELLLAWPLLFLSMRDYRRNHWPHHRHTNGPGDPDWERKQGGAWRFPQSRGALFLRLLSSLTGLGFIRLLVVVSRLKKPEAASDDAGFRRIRLVYLAALLCAITYLGGWRAFLLWWLLPFITWFQLAFHLRSIAEHFAIEGRQGLFARTRTTVGGLFDRIFLVPKNGGYHLEHHLFPGVPFYNLPRLHRRLMRHPVYLKEAHITRGYFNVVRECLGKT